nr:hypothetical protein [Tanacetum cinerariifolium]
MNETRQTTIPFLSHLNGCYCEDNKGSYGPQFLEAYSYGAPHIDKSIPRKEKDPGSFTLPCYINNVCFSNALAELRASVGVMPLSTYLNLVDFIIHDMPEDIKVPLILERPFLSTVHAMIDVFNRKIILRVGVEKIIFKILKPTSSLIKRVYMLILKERMKLDLQARLMGETLVLNRSLDPFFADYIELNNLNKPFELRRDRVDDLIPTIKEGKVIEEFRARNDVRMDKLEYKGNNVVGALMKIPIFAGSFSILTDFVVLEDMDTYRDEVMGDVIFGELFLRETEINAKRFKEMITIHNGNKEVTYQMVWSHPRGRHVKVSIPNKIMEYLVKISKMARSLELKRRYLKITVLTTNMPYPSRKIWCICACTSLDHEGNKIRYVVSRKDQYAVFKPYGNKILWMMSNVVPTLRNPLRRIKDL